jgi:pre-mRNA-splicing factor CWC26
VGSTSEFRKKKTQNRATIGAPAPSNSDQAAADAIIMAAAAETRARATADDDAPVIEGSIEDLEMRDADEPAPRAGGLQPATEVRAAAEKKRKAERRKIEEDVAAMGGKAQETVYRDASGRIINIAMKRAEARRAADAEAKKKADEADAVRGDAQIEMREQRKRELEDAKYMTVARGEDDVAMNDELKERDRWNDPAAKFLSTTKKSAGGPRSKGGKPTYQGAFQPNRYGIRPGHRWDGVDRSNGFEAKWFAARNKRKDKEDLEYAWQMDE